MAPQSPSIQSFFQPETPCIQPAVSNKDETGDKSTTTEANPFLSSTPHAWRPRIHYEDARISSLVPGPRCVHLVGRVVNFYDQPTSTSKLPYATKRCLNVLVRDDTGMIKVKLWFLSVDYQLRLSQLADEGKASGPASAPILFSSADVARTVTTNKGDLLDVVNVIVFDDTYDATLTICGCVARSVAHWKTSSTILLLSNPGFRSDRRPTLSINSTTFVEIDPCMGEAEWLRAFAQRLTTREVVNVPFPEGGVEEQAPLLSIFDVQAATKADVRVLFTLAELDE
ncbi:MAG: hypothetical protein Q9171_004225 [Xanthocarpia ochracea]